MDLKENGFTLPSALALHFLFTHIVKNNSTVDVSIWAAW
jgi:hypothetical protein